MADRKTHSHFLVQAGKLLLEYNESSGEIVRALVSTSRALSSDECDIAIAYRSVSVTLGDDITVVRTVDGLRFNAAAQTRIHEVLRQLREGRIDVESAVDRLGRVENETRQHSRWIVACLLGGAACSFSRLLGADVTALVTVGVSTAIGFLVRHELGRRRASMLTLPFAAAMIGAVLGGIVIQLGWTRTPELILVVPALMLVPGPHLLNGIFDLIDNHLPTSICRLGLSIGLLLASALGIVLGVRLTLTDSVFPERSSVDLHLNLASDMLLAGVATCGFAAFFNSPWPQLWMAVITGMAGHGVRFLALENGSQLEAATFYGGVVVGAASAWLARSSRALVAVIAFAGAVTMIPGSNIYRALAGMMRIAQQAGAHDEALVVATVSNAIEATVVVGGLGMGLVLGIRTVFWIADRFELEPGVEAIK